MKNRAALALFFLVATAGCKRSAPVAAGGAPATETAQTTQVAPAGPRDTKAARAANRQGMKRYRQKDMAGAAAAFRAAITADPKHVLAHYNLACVLALTGDKAGALAELGWLARSEDPAAARKLARAPEDADLKSLATDPQAVELFFAGTQRALFPGFRAAARGTPATEAQAAQLWDAWEHEPGELRDTNEVVQAAVSQDLVADRKGPETLLASASRIALLDAGGDVVASTALDDEDDRASVEHLWIGQVVPDAEPEIVLVTRWERGASHTITVTVYKRKADDLVAIAGAEVYSYWIKLDDESDDPIANADESEDKGEIALHPDGTIQMRSSGDKRPQTLRWDPQAFKFVKR